MKELSPLRQLLTPRTSRSLESIKIKILETDKKEAIEDMYEKLQEMKEVKEKIDMIENKIYTLRNT